VNRSTFRGVGLVAALSVLALIAAACGSSEASSSGDLTLTISAPKDHAKVSQTFTVMLDPSVPLGDPSTGEHHVHLCFDGQSCDTQYQLVYADSAEVEGLTPGEHTIEASLRNADHSDAGVSASITVIVTGSGGGASTSGTPSPSLSATDDGGYGY
jgi:hypothetical protein